MRLARHLTALFVLLLAAFAQAEGQRVLGKVGQSIAATGIYSSPSRHSKLFHRIPAYQYLVIRRCDNSEWYAVLLQSGNLGYTPASSVAVLPMTMYSKAGTRGGSTTSRSTTSRMANLAQAYTGTPYEWGGTDLSGGIDCSGFVQQVAGKIGMNLPRTAAEQAGVGTPINRLEDLRSGDRLYFYEKARGKIGHTGIYLGGGYFIHSSHGKGGVHTDFLSASWRKILVAARR